MIVESNMGYGPPMGGGVTIVETNNNMGYGQPQGQMNISMNLPGISMQVGGMPQQQQQVVFQQQQQPIMYQQQQPMAMGIPMGVPQNQCPAVIVPQAVASMAKADPIQVSKGEHRIAMGANNKPFREYDFNIAIPQSQTVKAVVRFSELRELAKSGALSGLLGDLDFPSRYFLRDYTKNEANCNTRAQELTGYLNIVFNFPRGEGAIITNPQFLACLKLTPHAALFQPLAQHRKAAADNARAIEAARLAAIRAQQQADCQWAQTFNQATAAGQMQGQLTTIAFPRPQKFILKNKVWAAGDAIIIGDGDMPWFKMTRTNSPFFASLLQNCQFAITTMAGEPLLMLQENFSWMNYVYTLSRVTPWGATIPVARITRVWSSGFSDQYEITLYAPNGVNSFVMCSGNWPNSFTLMSNGGVACTVDQKMWSFADKYMVHVAPNQDVLLFVGIACAIDRIHHEVEEARRERERREREERRD